MSEKYAGLTALQENVVKTKEHVEAVRAVLDAQKANVFQVTSMPQTPTEGQCVQFLGQTTVNYTFGSWYQYQEITPSTDPKTYHWVEVSQQITVDNSLSTTSTNPVQNNTLTNAIQALQDGVIVLYASESVLPQTVNYNTGVIVTIGTVGYCVSERSWHKVTAIDSTTLAITWASYDPHLASEILAGDAIEIDSTDNSVNVVADGETAFIASTTYYAWKDSNDNLVFTLSMTPSVGDAVYNESATATSDLVEAYDSTNLTIDVNSVTYVRDNADNYVKTALGGLIPNASDFNVSGRNVMLDVTQRTFTGTRDAFNSLSSAEKSKYLILNILDEVGQGITVVNTIANNNMNVPTSNAVYNYAVAKTLSSPLTLGGTQYTDVDTLLGAIVSVLNGSAYWQ